MACSTFLRAAALNHLFRTDELVKVPYLYWGLFTEDPTPDATGAEVVAVDTGYARQPIAVEDASWSAPIDAAGYMATHNVLPATFGDPTDSWGTPSHWGLFDAVTAGNLWFYGPILGTLSAIGAADDPISLAAESVTITAGQAASDYLETAFLNHCLRTATLTKPANVYASLHPEDPGDDGSGDEFTGTNYARVPIAVANASWTAPSAYGDAQRITNLGLIQFPSPGSEWGSYAYTGFWDAASGGNLLVKAPMEVVRLVAMAHNPPTWLTGSLPVLWS